MGERIIKITDKIPRLQTDLFLGTNPLENRIICLSSRSLWVIRFIVSHFYTWNSILGDFITPKLFRVANTDSQSLLRSTFDEILGAIDMSCDLSASLESIASSIRELSIVQINNNNCGSTTIGDGTRPVPGQPVGVIGSVEQSSGETVPIYGTQPTKTLPESGYPEGYESVEEYQLDRCQLANLIFDNAMATLYNIATFGVFDFGAVVGLIIASVVGLIVFPPAVVPLLAAFLGVLAVNVSILLVVRQEIIDRRETWVCWLYQGETVEWIIEQIADGLDEIIGLIPVSNPVGVAIKSIVLIILNGDTLNQLYAKQAHATYPDANCTSCDCNDTGSAGFFVLNGIPEGSGDLSVNCEQRTILSASSVNGYLFVGLQNTGINDLQITAVSATPSLLNTGNFGGLSGIGTYNVHPGSNIRWGGGTVARGLQMEIIISGLDTVNGV